jgi:acyl-CoA thioesterase
MHEGYIKDLFNECGVAGLVGVEVLEVEEGLGRGRLTIRKEHLNVFGDVHGGILFTFADHIGGACGNTFGNKAVLVESSVHYVKGSSGEGRTIFCEAVLTHRGKKIGRIDARVYEEDGSTIALVHQIFYIKDDEHAAEAR